MSFNDIFHKSLTNLSDYTILSVIGQGSFGKVYQARLKGTPKTVALKFVTKAQRSQAELAAIRQEANILTSINHPCIIGLYDRFETPDDIVFVMEYAIGDLRELGEAGAVVGESDIALIAAQLFHALHYLHSCRIIHRDIKPQNVLVREDRRVALADFGFARSVSTSTTALCSMKGTPLYMAPELVQGRAYDYRSDIWSLGCLLYELAVGRPPFLAANVVQLAQKVGRDPVSYPSTLSPQLKDLLSSLLVRDPAGRADWRQLARHPFVAAALAQMAPILSRDDPPWFQTRIVKPAPVTSTTTAALVAGANGAPIDSNMVHHLTFDPSSPLSDVSHALVTAALAPGAPPPPPGLLPRLAQAYVNVPPVSALATCPVGLVAAASAIPAENASAFILELGSTDVAGGNRDTVYLAAAAAVLRGGAAYAAQTIAATTQLTTTAANTPTAAALVLLGTIVSVDMSGDGASMVPWTPLARTLASALTLPPAPLPVSQHALPPFLRPVLGATDVLGAAAAWLATAAATASSAGLQFASSALPLIATRATAHPGIRGELAVAARTVLAAEVARSRQGNSAVGAAVASDVLCNVLAEYMVAAACAQSSSAVEVEVESVAAAGQALWIARAVRLASGMAPPIAAYRCVATGVIPVISQLDPSVVAPVITLICRIGLSHYDIVEPLIPILLAPATLQRYLAPDLPPESLVDGLVLLAHIGRVSPGAGEMLAQVPMSLLLGILQCGGGTDIPARLRAKCANAIGNMLRHSSAPLEPMVQSGVLHALVPLLSSTNDEARWAAFALGNAAFHNGDIPNVFKDAVVPLTQLLSHTDPGVRLNAAGGTSNLLRHAHNLHPFFAAARAPAMLEQIVRTEGVTASDVATAAALALCTAATSQTLRPSLTLTGGEVRRLAGASQDAQLTKALARLTERLEGGAR